MSCKTCHHVMEDGHFCQSPAVSKRDYCYHHIEYRARRLKMARTRSRGERWWLDLPNIEDMRSCQAAVVRVTEAIAAHLIEPEHAKLLLAALRLASSNFKARKAWNAFSDYHVNGSMAFVGKYPGFEAVHDLPADLDLDADPLKLFPMPEKTESVPEPLANGEERTANSGFSAGAPFKHAFGMSGNATTGGPQSLGGPQLPSLGNCGIESAGAPFKPSFGLSGSLTIPPPTGPYDQVTAEDMELNDIVRREGEQAMLKRAREMERNLRRRERQAKRKQFEAQARDRNIQLAAQRLFAEQQRHPGAAQAQSPAAATARAAQPPANSPAGVPNTPSPAGAATMTAQTKAGAGAPSGEPGLRPTGVVAGGGILGSAGSRGESRSDGIARKPPQPEDSCPRRRATASLI